MKIIKDFISDDYSKMFVQFHEKNFHLNNDFSDFCRRTQLIKCNFLLNLPQFKDLKNLLENFGKSINKNYTVNNFLIVKWPVGESQSYHYDFDYHPYTVVIYLNDDFEGGETVVETKKIKPKKNQLIGFEGNVTKHKVNAVTKGVRYTIVCWFKCKI